MPHNTAPNYSNQFLFLFGTVPIDTWNSPLLSHIVSCFRKDKHLTVLLEEFKRNTTLSPNCQQGMNNLYLFKINSHIVVKKLDMNQKHLSGAI